MILLWIRIGDGAKGHAFLNRHQIGSICGKTYVRRSDGRHLEKCGNCLRVIQSWPKATVPAA